MTPCKFL